MRNTITEDMLTNTFEVGDKMTGDAPIVRTPSKDTHGAPAAPRREAVGGPRHAPRATTRTTRPRFTASRFGYQHGCGAVVLKPEIIQEKNNQVRCKAKFTNGLCLDLSFFGI